VYAEYDYYRLKRFKHEVPYCHRRWDAVLGCWDVDPRSLDIVRRIYYSVYRRFPVEGHAQAIPSATDTLFVYYLGMSHSRDDGSRCSLGCFISNKNTWDVLIPESVLRAWFGDEGNTTYYSLLGVHSNVPQEALRAAYRRMAKQWHPDVCHEAGATERFKAINAAWEQLRDPASRARYDAALKLAALVPQDELAEYQPPLRCGLLTATYQRGVYYLIENISAWADVESGDTVLTTYYDDGIVERWTQKEKYG